MSLEPGTKVQTYEILATIGVGGMGEVYKAKDLKLGRDVAIKVLREELAADPERLQRFEQEARSASALNHPNIITIHDIGRHGTTPYMAMEFVDGKTLRETLDQGPLPIKKLLALAAQIADGLAKAHSAGIVHRDLKPQNLMVSRDGFVKILDFGLAKLMPESAIIQSEMSTVARDGTRAGAVMGTVGYMSPEQAKGRPLDHRSDQFSFGAILYEMATGKRAFHRDSSIQTLSAIIEKEPEAISVLNPEIPPHLRVIVERCLAKDPEERYDSTRDLARELKSIEIAPPNFREAAKQIRSLVVLPLANLSPDPEQEYFSDGMTEALITDLAKIGALKVISRTSAMRYKKTDKSMPEIGRELNVDAVVEGSVLRAGNRVRITAQLIKADADEHLWAESYERDLEDILFLQSDVARAIAGEIRARLTPAEETRFARAQSVNPAAHEACLKGRYHWNKTSPEGLKKAIEYFQKAIDEDPSYAPAYAGIADAFIAAGFWGFTPTPEAAQKAKEAALAAVELDDTLAEAHSALGDVLLSYDWDWSRAEAAVKRAIELNPGYAEAYRIYASCLVVTGRKQDAIRMAERSREIDPLSPFVNFTLGGVLEFSNHSDEAIEQYKKALELEPNFFPAHIQLGSVYWKKGRYEESLRELETGLTLRGRSELVEVMEKGYSAAGFKGATKAAAEKLDALSKHHYVSPYLVAYLYSYAEMVDMAMNWLERAYRERHMAMVYLSVGPWWDPWRSDPRFQDLVRRMNFPP